MYKRQAQQLIVGTTVEQAGFNKEVTEEGRRTIQTGAKEMVSRMASLSPEKSWAGLRPGTPDQMPLLGPTPLKRFLLAAGHYRNGILLAPLTGRLIADWITRGSAAFGGTFPDKGVKRGGSSSMDLSAFSVARFLAKRHPRESGDQILGSSPRMT